MDILISPAKRMKAHIDYMEAQSRPQFLEESRKLLQYMKTCDEKQLQAMLKCSKSIAQWTKCAYETMDLDGIGVPALLAYDGIQYQYMKPDLFTDAQFAYAQKHVFILSGFYGVLRALDGVMPYRLEMDSIVHSDFTTSLYAFWESKVASVFHDETRPILNLASKQYAKVLIRNMKIKQRLIHCSFFEEENGILCEKGVYVKMARGEMVRYLCVHHIGDVEGVKHFHALGYHYDAQLSSANTLVFIRKAAWKQQKIVV